MSDSLPPQDHSARPASLDRERGRDESSRGGDLPAAASSRYDDGREPRSPHRPSHTSDRRDDDYRDGNPRGRDTVESKTKLYVGNLSSKTEKRDIQEVFERCGPLVSVEVKHNGYAFVEFEDARDAEDAVHKLRDYELHGSRLTVEYSRSRQGGSGSGCFLCGGMGHWARECPDSRTRGMDVKSGLCFKCGQPGHLARHCRGGGGSYGGYRGGRDSYYGGRGRSRSPPRGYGRSPSPYGGRGGYGGGYGGDRRRSPVYNDYRGAPGGGYDDRRY